MAADDGIAARPWLSHTVTCAKVALEEQVLTDDGHDEDSEWENQQGTLGPSSGSY